MPPAQDLTGAVRRAGSLLPPGLRGPVARSTRRFRSFPGPLATVVVVVSDDETTQIEEGLGSLLDQVHRNLEVLVVGYGRCTQVLETARSCAERDWRLRILRRVRPDRAAALNAAVASARGEFVGFMHGGDSLLPRAIQRLVSSLERTGSNFALGSVSQPGRVAGAADGSTPVAQVRNDLTATSLEASPWAAGDLMLENRLFRKDFWRKHSLTFEEAPGSESSVVLAALAAAAAFDVLKDVTYVRSNRRAGEAIGSVQIRFSALDEWIAESRTAWRSAQATGVLPAAAAWRSAFLDTRIQPLLDDVERSTEPQWQRLREFVDEVVEGLGPVDWTAMRAESRVKLWLLRHDRREELESFVEQRWFARGEQPTEVRNGQVLARLPHFGDESVGVPLESYEMSAAETPLDNILHAIRWTDRDTLALGVFSRVRHVGMTGAPQVTAHLVNRATGERLVLDVELDRDLEANQVAAARFQDYSWGAFTAEIGPAALETLAASGQGPGRGLGQTVAWELEVSLSSAGVSRTAGLTAVDERSSVGAIGMGHVAARGVGESMIGPCPDPERVMTIQVAPRIGPEVLSLEAHERRLSLTLDLRGNDVDSVLVRGGGVQVEVAVSGDGDEARLSLEVPEPPKGRRNIRWLARAVTSSGDELFLRWPQGAGQWLTSPDGAVAGHRTHDGCLDLVEAADALVVDSVDLVDGDVHVQGHWLGKAPENVSVSLAGPKVTIEGERLDANDGVGDRSLRMRFRMQHDPFGLGAVPVPLGRYWFECAVEEPNRDDGRVLLSCDALDAMLRSQVDDTYRLRTIRRGRAAGVALLPPLREDDRGPYAHQRNQAWCCSGEIPLDPDAVYLQSYVGASATDSQLAIHEELRRRHPHLRLYWGVADMSSRVPEGGIPVLLGSREYFRVLGSAGHLIVNIDFDRWFTTRPGQRLLQTFHGYPAKSMGIRMWEAKGFSPRRIAAELCRTAEDWDLILTPAPEMDVHYRREYAYGGEIHSAGYPRDDVLVSDGADRIREDVRRRLGIRPEQKVILYAPTWRDDLATNWRKARLVRHLDLETASRQLGPDYVLLMRGHRFHSQAAERSPRTSRLIDVTDYPEINDLVLAADAAVLDYSSLRFDFALTGRPMVFLVPDLASYTGGVRGFLYDFEGSAPGPLLEQADDVVERLRDLPRLAEEYADEVAQFNRTYNYLQDGHAAERVVHAFFGE